MCQMSLPQLIFDYRLRRIRGHVYHLNDRSLDSSRCLDERGPSEADRVERAMILSHVPLTKEELKIEEEIVFQKVQGLEAKARLCESLKISFARRTEHRHKIERHILQ